MNRMNFSESELVNYLEAHSTPISDLLHELERQTHLQFLRPQMLSGSLQGRFLQLISQMIRPKRILEIGTYTGFSAICLAQGLSENGSLHTIEANEELEDFIRHYLAKARLSDRVKLYIDDAMQCIPKLEGPFDLIFMDANKRQYGAYYDMVFEQWQPGGFMIVDNVLWSGKVILQSNDRDTRYLQDFNAKVQADKRVENLVLPFRDGLSILRKY